MRLVTWNVNGIRSLQSYHPWNASKSFKPVLDSFHADIICFQETKITRDRFSTDICLVDGYDAYATPTPARRWLASGPALSGGT